MRISVGLEGAADTIKALKTFKTDRDQKIQDAINLTAQLIRTDAIRSMKQSPATGNRYERRSITHTASSAPNPPRVDTGRLINSVKALINRLEAFVGTNVEYGPYLEFGTRGKDGVGKIEARPWLFPAFERQRRNFVNRLREAMR
jgi:phage gpG-like protein